jgi:Uncharacterized protein conserved in bacteria (DUF2188)
MVESTATPAATRARPGLPARWPSGPQSRLLESWPRLAEVFTRAILQTEEALLGAHLAVLQMFMVNNAHGLNSWAASTQRAQSAALEFWQTLLAESERLGRATVIDLSYSAADLLDQLEKETAARARLEQQHKRERERADLERSGRERAERERSDQRRQAEEEHRAREQAERANDRLQRELAHERERAAQAERKLAEVEAEARHGRERAARAEQPPPINVVHREDDWAVVREDAKRASGVFGTKREALQRAREMARREGAEVQVKQAEAGQGHTDNS